MTLFAEQRPTVRLGLYSLFARIVPLSYRNKIMLVAFLGTNIPLLALVAWYALASAPSLSEALWVIGVTLVATLVGTGLTLVALNELLQPILMTARGLRRYAVDHTVPALPTGFTDDAGTLMADTVETLTRLEATFKQLAYHDQLTGLPNREHLLEVLARRLIVHRHAAQLRGSRHGLRSGRLRRGAPTVGRAPGWRGWRPAASPSCWGATRRTWT